MSRRTRAGLMALSLLVALAVTVMVVPLPYVTYYPGPAVDVLGETDGQEHVRVSGQKAYYDEGRLRLTTIYVDEPQEHVNLYELLTAYFDGDAAVYPRSAVYAPEETDESSDVESSVAMVSSQDAAVAAALSELGHEVAPVVEVLHVVEGMPADGRLEVRDVLLRVGDTEIDDAQDVVEAVDEAPVGEPLRFVVRRGKQERTVTVTPREVGGDKRVGITPGPGYTFPFDVSVDIDDNIGGPSAGLVFALAIYDTLTPGSLTDGRDVAGTGEINGLGEVGPIGGIQQKVAGARDAGAELFLVPEDNCKGIAGVDPENMRLARVSTLHEAVSVIEEWTKDPDATLPTCEELS